MLETSERGENGEIKLGKPASRYDNSKTLNFVARKQQIVKQNICKSIWSRARELGVANVTIYHSVQENLRHSSYVFKHGHFTSNDTKQMRLEKAKKMHN